MSYEDQQKRIEKAIDAKQKSIAFWASTNNSSEIVNGYLPATASKEERQKELVFWRDFLYQEWCGWYLENIEPSKDEQAF